ncbi:MAG TPA: hypothetical protein VF339_06555 [Gammaproteobacteria bacterium]
MRESEKRAAELQERLEQRAAPPEGSPESALVELEQRLQATEAERDRLAADVARLEEVLEEERAKAAQLKAKLDVAESGPDKLTKKEINFWRSKVDDFDKSITELKARIAELRREVQERDAQIEALTARERELTEASDGSARRLSELESENAGLGTRIEEQAARIEEQAARLEEQTARIAELEAELERKEQERRSLADELAGAREQIAGLEQELRDEKECTDNLSEVANERRELITSLEDRLAEAEERYEEARWRLGKAQHFERLVKRRKKLIKALIEKIRQKHKSNVALKAGLDGLRTYKAAAEAKQHELLKRIDKLNARIREQEETIARHHASTVAKEMFAGAQMRVEELEKRVEAQIEIIQTLEEELKTAKAMQQVRADYGAEVERLRSEVARLTEELEAKTKIVERLENDSDEQQRKLAKLRLTESETLRLKTQIKEQEAAIASLTEEVDGWKRKYEFMMSDSTPPYRSAAEK